MYYQHVSWSEWVWERVCVHVLDVRLDTEYQGMRQDDVVDERERER